MSDDPVHDVAPKYADGREVSAPRSTVTTTQISIENKVFWEMEALRERVEGNQNFTEDERALMLAHGEVAIRYRLAEPERIIRANDAARRAKGTANSAGTRRDVERDRRIHDLGTEGKDTSIIAKREEISASQVRRILKKPRP